MISNLTFKFNYRRFYL